MCVLDTPESTTNRNYMQSSIAMAASMYEYLKEEVSFAKLRIFHGKYIDNIQEESEYIKDLDISKNSFDTALNLVKDRIWPAVKDIDKTSGSEGMFTALYFAIDKTMTQIEESISTKGIGNIGLNAVNFLLLTHDYMFRFDELEYDASIDVSYIIPEKSQLRGYRHLIGLDISTGDYDKSKARSPWFANWQENTFGKPRVLSTSSVNDHNCYLRQPSTKPVNFSYRFPVPNMVCD